MVWKIKSERMVKWHTKKNWKEEKVDAEYEHKTNILKLSFDVHSNGLWGYDVHWNDKKSLVSSDMDALNGSRTLLSSSWLSGYRWWQWYVLSVFI